MRLCSTLLWLPLCNALAEWPTNRISDTFQVHPNCGQDFGPPPLKREGALDRMLQTTVVRRLMGQTF